MDIITVTKEETETRGRYVARVDGYEAELTFSKPSPTHIIADHTGVPPQLGGRGIGTTLINAMVADARSNGFKITPQCSFIEAQYARHPEWADVML